MKIKGAIFDMDGTLLNTIEDLAASTNFALNKLGLKTRRLDEIKNFVGNGAKKLIERATGENINYQDKCYELFLNHYKTNSLNLTKPYNKAKETLYKLKNKGIKLAVLSNKPDSEVKKLCEYFFANIFDISIGVNEIFPPKPDKFSCEYIIKNFNLKKENIAFVGDSEVDIETAKNAGIKCFSVCWGYKTKDFLLKSGAQNISENFEELYQALTIPSKAI